MPLVPPHAAGLDVGAEAHGGCVPADRDVPPLQQCSACTCAVYRLANWVTACRLTTGVMASTGVYGMPLLQILAARGCAVALVNARHAPHVPGRPQTDRFDCRGLHKLHR